MKKQEGKTQGYNTKTDNKRIILLSKYERDNKKVSFIKKQEASGWLRFLGLMKPLSKIPLLGNIVF